MAEVPPKLVVRADLSEAGQEERISKRSVIIFTYDTRHDPLVISQQEKALTAACFAYRHQHLTQLDRWREDAPVIAHTKYFPLSGTIHIPILQ